ncbi:MAG: RagB/SusD family nutrient uptake outer membrane protein [Ginsengibacter sp.]
MKKLIILLSAVCFFTSCKKLLDENPKYSINSKNAFNSTATTQMALDACYGYLISWNAYGQAYFELTLGASGESWSQTNGGDGDQLASLNTLTSNGTLNQVWNGLYKAIGECNAFIQNVNGGTLTNDQKNYYAAQAKFIRALCYYNLVGIWGDVPLRTTPSDISSLSLARTPKADVIKQVAGDWVFAAQYLPASLNPTEQSLSVPTRYAAYAYLAKLYWTLGSNDNTSSSPNWAIAKKYGDSVLNAKVYSLEPNFSNLFKPVPTNSKEMIFKLNTSTNLSGLGPRLSWLLAPSNSTTGISWGRYKASKSLYDFFKGTYPDDPRLNVTFQSVFSNVKNGSTNYAYPYISYKKTINGVSQTVVASINYSILQDPTNPTIDELNQQDPQFVTKFTAATGNNEGWAYYNKYVDPKATAQLSNSQVLVYRYADFLLLMADVYNEMGQKDVAVSLINQVLSRARNSASPASVYPQDVTVAMSQADLRDKVFNERLFELAGEPDMFFDTRSRGVEYFRKILQRNNDHHVTYTFATNPNIGRHNFKDRLFNAGNITDDFLKKNLVLPIPQSELNTNDKITTADQNYGY